MDAGGLGPTAASFAALAPAVEETHISVLLLVGDRVYKLKKPVHFPFLDWRTREARQVDCRREVELNRRLAPDVYLGVVDVVDDDGVPCDHLVVMRRMPDDRRLSRLVREGAVVEAPLDELARRLAAFHAAAGPAPRPSPAGRDAVRRNWEDNLEVLRDHTEEVLDDRQVAAVDRLAHRYLAGRSPLFEERASAGLVVDGHGDLLADDIYLLPDGPRVLDCLEFSEAFRTVDVLDDVAFLAMDLERLGAPALGDHFLRCYEQHRRESHPRSLFHHFVAYRAGVRSKVACLRADQGDDEAAAVARRLLQLAEDHLAAARVRLVLVGGLPGTGKSTLASGIAARRGWELIRSDCVRKELLGMAPSTSMPAPFGEGIYRPEHTAATYGNLLTDARHRLERGASVVLDASWSDPAWRAAANEVAATTSSDLVALRCVAPTEVGAARLLARAAGDPSDADPDIAAAMATVAVPWPEAAVIDTTRAVEVVLDTALGQLA